MDGQGVETHIEQQIDQMIGTAELCYGGLENIHQEENNIMRSNMESNQLDTNNNETGEFGGWNDAR